MAVGSSCPTKWSLLSGKIINFKCVIKSAPVVNVILPCSGRSVCCLTAGYAAHETWEDNASWSKKNEEAGVVSWRPRSSEASWQRVDRIRLSTLSMQGTLYVAGSWMYVLRDPSFILGDTPFQSAQVCLLRVVKTCNLRICPRTHVCLPSNSCYLFTDRERMEDLNVLG